MRDTQALNAPEGLAAKSVSLLKLRREAFKRRDFVSYLALHENDARLAAFKRISSQLAPSDYWSLVRALWITTDRFKPQAVWERILMSDPDNRHLIMNEEERVRLVQFPELVNVYFGCIDTVRPTFLRKGRNQKRGISWALREAIAKQDAMALSKSENRNIKAASMLTRPYVIEGQVKKENIFACFREEVIAFPRDVLLRGYKPAHRIVST